MRFLKTIITLICISLIFATTIYSQNNNNNQKQYYLMYDWILDKPLFPIKENEITLYPFLIEQTKGSDFVSYKVLSLWNPIGAESSGTNITNIAGFKSAYIKGSIRSVELENYGVFTIDNDLKIKKDKNAYVAVSNKGNLKVSNEKKDDIQTIKYNDYQNNEVLFEIDYSSKTNKVKKYINHQLTISSEFKRNNTSVTINSLFAGQKLTEFKKISKSSYLASLGTFFKTELDKNTTKITSSGKELSIIKDSKDRIASIKLINNGKIEYTEDYEFFDEYILITKFNVVEKIQTEIELGYNDIVLYEVKKNIEDVVFYEYVYDPDSDRAESNKYFSGKKIATYNYDLQNGIKELLDIEYYDEEEKCKTVKKFDGKGKEQIEIKRESGTIFDISTNDEFYNYDPYPRIKSQSGTVKNSRLKISDKVSIIENNLSGVKVTKNIQSSNDVVNEELDFSQGYLIKRRYSHGEYSYDDKLINNSPYQFKNESQFKIGIGSSVIGNSLSKEIIKKYNSQGMLISKRISNDTLFWNSLYGYNDNSLSVIKDMLNGALIFISIFSKAEDFINKITYDKSSGEIKNYKLAEGLEILIKVCRKAIQLKYEYNIITQNISNQYQGIPIIKLETKLNEIETDKTESLMNVEKREYKIGFANYKEAFDVEKSGKYYKTVKDNRFKEYQVIEFDKNSQLEKIKVYGKTYNGLFQEAEIEYDRVSLPKSVKIKRINETYKISPSFIKNGAKFKRSISQRNLSKEIELILGKPLKDSSLIEGIQIKGLEVIENETIQDESSLLNNGSFIVKCLTNEDEKMYYIKYYYFMPIKYYELTDNNLEKEVFIKDFVPYAIQSYEKNSANTINSTITDTLNNKILTQEIELNSKGNISKIITDAGSVGEYQTEIEYYPKGLIKSRVTKDKASGNEYKLEYIYGDKLSVNVETFFINNTDININLTIENKDGKKIGEKNYRYSVGNGLWYEESEDEIIVKYKAFELIDRQIQVPIVPLIDSYVYPKEFWWVFKINL